MKTQSQWLQMLSKCGTGHPAACCCDRCKKGVETVLLESDIAEIQRDAREGIAKELAEAKVYIEELEQERNYVEQQLVRPGEHGLPFTVDRVVYELKNAREGMVPESDFQPLIDCVMLYDSGGIAEELATLRAKHPNLFTK